MRFVVKLGTSTLTAGTSRLSRPQMVDLVRQMTELRRMGHEVILVSSGAMATGLEILGFPQLPKSLPAKQMLSAVGQPRLMDSWAALFSIYDCTVAQVLLTRSDLRARSRYLNARNTLLALLDQGVIPIVNENDTVATEEIRVGDNDNLSALVANLILADYLLLLTDQDGLFTSDPRQDPDADLIPIIDESQLDADVWQAAGNNSGMGVGGMATKLQAADLARRAGTTVFIARGSQKDVMLRIAQGEAIGTRILPTGSLVESFKRYLLSGGEFGSLQVDAGAQQAIVSGRSLLPPGLRAVEGRFSRGETVRVLGPDGQEIARGLVNYRARDCRRLIGQQSAAIEEVLGHYYGDEIIHRSNLVLM